MSKRRDDLKADLLADLTPPAPVAEPPAPEPVVQQVEVTPAVSVQLTPLRWSRPSLSTTSDGLGKSVKVGPFAIELSFKE